jgi:hypothetical protein
LNFLRTGYRGIGNVELPELFLRGLDEQILGEWIAKHFVAGNAAIWVTGELPHDLYESLEPGPATPVPEFAPIPGFEGPTMLTGDFGGVSASFLVDRGLAIQVGLNAAEHHLQKALRVDRGLGYAVGSDYRPISADRALARVFATCLPGAVAEVQRAVLETIDDIAARGASDVEIADYYERMVRDVSDVMAFPGRLDRTAADMLMGLQPKLVSTQLDELWRMEPEQVATAFRAARETMLLLLPSNAIPPNRAFKPFPSPSPDPLGRGYTFDYKPRDKSAPFNRIRPKLFVGGEGVVIDTKAGRYLRIPWDDCVAVIRDANDRTILSFDGSSFTLEPETWRDGYHALSLVDRFAPSQLVVKDAK